MTSFITIVDQQTATVDVIYNRLEHNKPAPERRSSHKETVGLTYKA